MALPSSGNISLLDIKTEFGGDGALTSYYRGGTYVPNTAANAGVPTSGSIGITHFYGASASTPFTSGRSPSTIVRNRASSGVLNGSITLTASGGTGSYTYATVWLSGGAGITILNAATASPSVESSANIPPDTSRSGTLRSTISDGVSSATYDTPVSMTWGAA